MRHLRFLKHLRNRSRDPFSPFGLRESGTVVRALNPGPRVWVFNQSHITWCNRFGKGILRYITTFSPESRWMRSSSKQFIKSNFRNAVNGYISAKQTVMLQTKCSRKKIKWIKLLLACK
ncbi:hypothetical protein ElyMa_005182600 [Elysia marginata]|uniref:Uncharacterized protein n=1 Tax=Elysia marginata TaxID=1093978 RepID=A0AAV4JSW8_9GAST|nr:hypothetical protein ElyMa_005182600 [Elysia marginata]